MQGAVLSDLPGVQHVLKVYARNANGVDPTAKEFLRDLADIEEIAGWAAQQGTELVTLEVNW
jgi:hypothetical protein